jgi:hypothetical protein
MSNGRIQSGDELFFSHASFFERRQGKTCRIDCTFRNKKREVKMTSTQYLRIGLTCLFLTMGLNTAFANPVELPNPQDLTLAEATEMVAKSLENTEIMSSKSYCTKGTMTCRTMYRLKNTLTGEPSPVFYDSFYSADRQVASTCYFIPSKIDPTQYYVLTDDVFDGMKKKEIKIVGPLYAKIQISENGEDIVFANLKSPKLGTTQYTLGEFHQTEDSVILKGITYDSENPDFHQDVLVEYLRIKP